MRAFKDPEMSSEIAPDNRVQIGDRVFVRISANEKLPQTVDYYLTDCTAYQDFQTKKAGNFEMIKVHVLILRILFYKE